jgi:hypothetical protein
MQAANHSDIRNRAQFQALATIFLASAPDPERIFSNRGKY